MLEVEGLRRLDLGDLVGRRLDPALLLGGQARPRLVADPDQAVVGLVLGHRQDRRHFVVLVHQVDVDAVLGGVDHAGLQRGVDVAERHVHGLRAIGGEHRVLGRRRLDADLHALDVLDLLDLALAVDIAQAERGHRQHMGALHGIVDHLAHRLDDGRIGHRLDQMVFRAEQEVQRHHAGLRRQGGGIGRRADAEFDVARFHELQDLRLLAELGAGILVDQHRALAEFLQLVGEHVADDAVAGRVGLVVGELVVLGLGVGGGRGERQAGRQEQGGRDAAQKRFGHGVSPSRKPEQP